MTIPNRPKYAPAMFICSLDEEEPKWMTLQDIMFRFPDALLAAIRMALDVHKDYYKGKLTYK